MHENNVGEINGKPLIHQVINRLNCTLLQHSPFIYTTANAPQTAITSDVVWYKCNDQSIIIILIEKINNEMKNWILLSIITFILISCESYSHSKFYDFKVKNELSNSIIKIVPLTDSDFWLLSTDTILIMPDEKLILGSRHEFDNNKKITDLYSTDDKIESFDVYIDNVKSNIEFSKRTYWTFETGPVDESATYLLTINEKTITLN